MRRDFSLPEEDREFLETLGLPWETVTDGATQWCVVHEYPFPEEFNALKGSVAIRIQPNYLTAGLDMAYFQPLLARRDGRSIPALSNCNVCGAQWQQWSRHYPWKAGVDSLASHLLQVKQWLHFAAKN